MQNVPCYIFNMTTVHIGNAKIHSKNLFLKVVQNGCKPFPLMYFLVLFLCKTTLICSSIFCFSVKNNICNNLEGRSICVALISQCGTSECIYIHVAAVLFTAEWQWCILLVLPPLQFTGEHPPMRTRIRIQQPVEGGDATSIPVYLNWGGRKYWGATSQLDYYNLKVIFSIKPLNSAKEIEHSCWDCNSSAHFLIGHFLPHQRTQFLDCYNGVNKLTRPTQTCKPIKRLHTSMNWSNSLFILGAQVSLGSEGLLSHRGRTLSPICAKQIKHTRGFTEQTVYLLQLLVVCSADCVRAEEILFTHDWQVPALPVSTHTGLLSLTGRWWTCSHVHVF